MRGQEDVSRYLKESGVDHELRVLQQSTRTSPLAAQALGCTIDQIAKSVVFLGSSVTVVVLSGGRRVDLDKLRDIVGEGVRAGSPDEVAANTGYRIGGVPPFPHGSGVRVLVDSSILEHETVWAAAGAPNAVFRIRAVDLARLVGGSANDISVGGEQI